MIPDGYNPSSVSLRHHHPDDGHYTHGLGKLPFRVPPRLHQSRSVPRDWYPTSWQCSSSTVTHCSTTPSDSSASPISSPTSECFSVSPRGLSPWFRSLIRARERRNQGFSVKTMTLLTASLESDSVSSRSSSGGAVSLPTWPSQSIDTSPSYSQSNRTSGSPFLTPATPYFSFGS